MADTANAVPRQSGKRDFSDLKKIVAPILNLDPHSNSWSVLDARREESLALVHYKETGSGPLDPSLMWLRGVVVDYKNNYVVATSHGTSKSVVTNKVNLGEPISNEEGYSIVLDGHFFDKGITLDSYGREYIDGVMIPFSYDVREGHEGTLIRVLMHNGKIYYATHRRLDFVNSKWGDSETFELMWEQLGGSSAEDLFGENDQSPFVYFFIIQHNSLMAVSREEFPEEKPGRLILIEKREMWSYENSPFNVITEEGENVNNFSKFKDTFIHFIHEPNWFDSNVELSVTLERSVFHPLVASDPYRSVGEIFASEEGDNFIIVYKYSLNPDGSRCQFLGITKIESVAYNLRYAIHGGILPNLWYQFVVEGTNYMIGKSPISELPKVYLQEPSQIINEIKDVGHYQYAPLVDEQNLYKTDTPSDRLRAWWLCFLIAIPRSHHKEIGGFYDKFFAMKKKVVLWTKEISRGSEPENLSPRIKKIIELSHQGARKESKGKTGKGKTYQDNVDINITNFFNKEDGMSMYKLFRNYEKLHA
jgi:hypothetical protein